MIIKTDLNKTSGGSRQLIHHLFEKPEDNETITTVQGSPRDIQDFFRYANSINGDDAVVHIKFSPDPDEEMNTSHWGKGLLELAEEFGFNPYNATIVEHKKKGRVHRHIVASAWDMKTGKKLRMWRSKYRSQYVAKNLEEEFGHKITPLTKGAQYYIEHRRKEAKQNSLVIPESGMNVGPIDLQKGKARGIDVQELKEHFKAFRETHNDVELLAEVERMGFKVEENNTGSRIRLILRSISDKSLTLSATRTIGIRKDELTRILKEKENVFIQQKEIKQEAGAKFSVTREAKAINSVKTGPDNRQERTGDSGGTRTASQNRGNTGYQSSYRGTKRRIESAINRGTFPSPTDTRGFDINSPATRNDGQEARPYAGTDKQPHTATKTHSERVKGLFTPLSTESDKRATYKLNTEFNGDIVVPKKYIFSVRPESDNQSLSELAEKTFNHYNKRTSGKYRHNLKDVQAVQEKSEFYLKVTTKQGQVFKDYGTKIISDKSDVKPSTASEIVRAAKARGWKTLTVTGTQEYKDELTIQAELQGLKTNHELSDKARKKLVETQIKFNRDRNRRIIQDYIKKQQNKGFEM